MSDLPLKADISESHRHVRFVPKTDIRALFYDLVGAHKNGSGIVGPRALAVRRLS
jgi:hypothetical protein